MQAFFLNFLAFAVGITVLFVASAAFVGSIIFAFDGPGRRFFQKRFPRTWRVFSAFTCILAVSLALAAVKSACDYADARLAERGITNQSQP